MISVEERAQIFWDELTSFKHLNPVGWIAVALRQFQQEIVDEVARPALPNPPTHLTLAASAEDGD